MKYAVVIEQGPTSFGAYVQDLPGCVAVGETQKEAVQLIREAIEIHFSGILERGENILPPSSSVTFVDVVA